MGPVLFADTYFFIARLWPRDQHHARAVAWEQYLLRNQLKVVTTEAVLWEILNALSHRRTRRLALDAYRAIHADPSIEVIGFDSAPTTDAIELYRDRDDKDWGITDCLSFAVMGQRGIAEALTADNHFTQAGFTGLLLQDPRE